MSPDWDALTVWGNGQLFAFSGLDGPTDVHRGIVAQSIKDGLLLRQPGLTKLETGRVHTAQFGSDWAILSTQTGLVRLCFLDAHHLLIDGDVQLTTLDDEFSHLIVSTVKDGTLLAARGYAAPEIPDLDSAITARRRWLRGHVAELDPIYEDLGRKAMHQMKGMVYAPEGQMVFRCATPDRYPHRDIWLWDSVFHAIGYRHLDGPLARDILSAVAAAQLPSGLIPISFGPYASRTHRSQPPVLAWGVHEIMQYTPDPAWLAQMLPVLQRYLAWFETHRGLDGLFGWVEDDGALGSVCDESGMDNSPRFFGGDPLQAVDLSCYMAQEYQAMAVLDPSGDWASKAAKLTRHLHQELWHPARGFYCDRNPKTGQLSEVEAVTGFLPLILGDVTADRVAALINAAEDPMRFGTSFPLPSMSKNAQGYAKDMWQGPVWINMNWMIARGFARCGADNMANALRTRTLDVMQNDYRVTGSIFEYYDDDAQVVPPKLLRKGKTDAVIDPKHPSIHLVIHDYGWSATLALDWILRGEV